MTATSSRPQVPFQIIGPINQFPSKSRIQNENQKVQSALPTKNSSNGVKRPLKLDTALLNAHF